MQACPKCGSKRWMTGLTPFTDRTVRIAVNPPTWKDYAKGVSELKASACADCWYVELYAVTPSVMWEEWSKQNR